MLVSIESTFISGPILKLYSASNPVRTELHFSHFVMVITVLWAELWFVVVH